MAKAKFANVLDYLRAVAAPQLSDGQLLQRYLSGGDAAAFAVLVRRHGPLVHGLCRRIVGPGPDLDDVFQATFLVLSQKAASIRKQGSVAEWLHGVAYRLATRVKSRRDRRWRREQTIDGKLEQIADPAPTHRDPATQAAMREVGSILDQELQRLPKGYGDALVLCLMEGLSHVEAARRLGCPVGTLHARVQRGRELLRQRLERRGVSLSAVALSVVIAERAVAVPPALVHGTLECVSGQGASAKVVALAATAMSTWGSMLAKVAGAAAFGVMLAGVAVATLGLATREVNVQPPPTPQAATVPQVKELIAAKDASGDQLPRGALTRLGTTRWRHAAPVHFLAMSPDGKTVVSAADDRYVRVWDFGTGKELRRFGPGPGDFGLYAKMTSSQNLAVAAVSRDAQFLAATFDRPTIELWNLATGKELPSIPVTDEKNARRLPGALAFAPDGKQLAIAENSGTIRLWDIDAGKVARELIGQTILGPSPLGRPIEVAYAPDGKTLVSVLAKLENQTKQGADVKFWGPATGREIRSIAVPAERGVGTPVFAPDGKWLALPTWLDGPKEDSEVWLIATDSGEVSHKWKMPVTGVTVVTFSADGARIFANINDSGAIGEWDARTGQELRRFEDTGPVGRCLTASLDGRYLIYSSSGHTIRSTELATGKNRPAPPGHAVGLQVVSFTPDGKWLLTRDTRSIYRVWNTFTAEEGNKPLGPAKQFSKLVSGDGRYSAVRDADGNIVLTDNDTGKEISKIPREPGPRFRWPFFFAPDGRTLLVQQGTPTVAVLYDVATGKERCQIQLPQLGAVVNQSSGLWFSPNGQRLGIYVSSTGVRIHETFRGQAVATIPLEELSELGILANRVRSAAISHDCRTVALEHHNGRIQVIELATGKERYNVEVKYADLKAFRGGGGISMMRIGGQWPASGTAATVAFSPDGRLLAHGGEDGVLRVFNAHTGKALAQFEGHTGSIRTIDFAPDGRSLATGSDDTTVLVWDFQALDLALPRTSK
jgi:RNA polymerase sigma factor (sigma-70 family)